MAWGDLRYDHSDIFGSKPGVQKKVRVGAEPLKEKYDPTIGPGHPTWQTILRLCLNGATVARIGSFLRHKNPRGNTARLLRRMVAAGVLTVRRESTGARGQAPYVYYTVREGRADGC